MPMRLGIALLVVAAVAALQVPSASEPGAESYTVDPVHSVVLFRIEHLKVGAFHGRFDKISGSFTVDEAGAGSVEVTVDAASVNTGNEQRDGHLKSPDFFNVKQFPSITFKSNALKRVDGKTYEAVGQLTLHGVTKPLTVTLERIGSGKGMQGEYRTGFEAIFTIKRSDFGMNWRLDLLGDEVRVTVAVEGIRE